MSLDLSAALRRHLLQRFPPTRDYPRAALRAAGMPPLIGGFLDRTLDRWVEIERAQIHSDWFDFAIADVAEAEERFFGALSRTARVPAAAWKGTLGGTVDLVVRYLTTPARALTDAIFEGSADPLPADAVRARLPMFDAYPYFADIGGAYLERKRTETLEPPDLFGLLDRIDRRFVSEFGPDEWVDLLAPLFALARQVPEFDGVPASLLKRFFEMKGEPDLAMPLGKLAGTALDEAALHALIADVLDEDPVGVAPVRTNGHAHASAPAPEPAAEEAEEIDDEPLAADAEETVGEGQAEADEPDADEVEAVEMKSEVPESDELELEELELDEPEASDEALGVASEDLEPEPEAYLVEPDLSEPDLHAPDLTEPELSLADADDEAPVADERLADEGAAEAEVEDAVPLWQRFAASGDANVNAQFSDDLAEAPADVDEPEAEPDAAPLWKRFFGRPDERPAAPPLPARSDSVSPDLVPQEPARPERPARASSLEELERRVLGASTSGQRTRFVKHLFAGDAGKYATVLHTLDDVDTWTEASQVIARDVFRPFRVNIYSEHAVAFTDAVEARFRA
ncbi:MAG: hypothetical protein ABJF88_10355 [Rhodothermales bacterium]